MMLERDIMTLILFYLKKSHAWGLQSLYFLPTHKGTFYILNMLDGNDMNTLHNNCTTIEIYRIPNMHSTLKINSLAK